MYQIDVLSNILIKSYFNFFQKPVVFQKKGIRIGLLSYCINNEGCTEERVKTFIGPAIYNKREVEEDLINLRKVFLLSSFICAVFTKTNSSGHMFYS